MLTAAQTAIVNGFVNGFSRTPTAPRRGLSSLLVVALLLWLGLVATAGAAAPVVGQVIFAAGEGQRLAHGDDTSQMLNAGSQIHEGDELTTGPQGHLHMRMVDGAFISLRSDSALSVERYRYRPETPDRSEARLTLHHGVVRSITGEIGARSRERFRLNTPVAAIGIRGTDFSVLTDNALSRLSVRQGGVVMAPLSAQCPRLEVGPCEGGSAAELFATQLDTLLETRRGDSMARLTREGVAPDEYRLPHPREDDLATHGSHQTQPDSALVRGKSQRGAESYEESLQQVERYLARPGLITDAFARGEAASDIQPRDRNLVEQPKVVWGRWSDFEPAGQSSRISQLIFNNRQYVGMNSVFALMEEMPEQRRLPKAGRAHFNLNRYEAYIKRGGHLESASISHPGLVVDFEQQRFAARLDVHADSLPGPVQVLGGGHLLDSGLLRSDGESPSTMEGVLTSGAGEAGLLFDFQIERGMNAVGATHWALDRE